MGPMQQTLPFNGLLRNKKFFGLDEIFEITTFQRLSPAIDFSSLLFSSSSIPTLSSSVYLDLLYYSILLPLHISLNRKHCVISHSKLLFSVFPILNSLYILNCIHETPQSNLRGKYYYFAKAILQCEQLRALRKFIRKKWSQIFRPLLKNLVFKRKTWRRSERKKLKHSEDNFLAGAYLCHKQRKTNKQAKI